MSTDLKEVREIAPQKSKGRVRGAKALRQGGFLVSPRNSKELSVVRAESPRERAVELRVAGSGRIGP